MLDPVGIKLLLLGHLRLSKEPKNFWWEREGCDGPGWQGGVVGNSSSFSFAPVTAPSLEVSLFPSQFRKLARG